MKETFLTQSSGPRHRTRGWRKRREGGEKGGEGDAPGGKRVYVSGFGTERASAIHPAREKRDVPEER